MPIFSLPGNYGTGCFSAKAYEFVDRLKRAGQSYWQILPLGPTGYGDSPYQSFSSFAGNPYFIDLDELAEQGLLRREMLENMDWGADPRYVDYGKLWENRERALREAFHNFQVIQERLTQDQESEASAGQLTKARYEAELSALNEETRNYCLYQTIKTAQGGSCFSEWEDALRLRERAALEQFREQHAQELAFYEWVQVVFHFQWRKLKDYANRNGVQIIGDMPIYVSQDSADAWAHPELFQMDTDAKPLKLAGCPPDYFSPDGQLWGNPLYDWNHHRKSGYAWWIRRMEYAFSVYDVVRVDHFRAFDEYYAISAKESDARSGVWEPGPGIDFFRALRKHFPKLPIIAEDLGLLTDSVIQLVRDTGFPSMKVLEFAYNSDHQNLYLPHNYGRSCVAYTGTHDNEPLMAWIRSQSGELRLRMIRYQGSEHTPEHELYWDCIRTVLASVADTVIIPMWDYLGAGEEARINTPSAAGGNWRWRMLSHEFDEQLIWHCNMLSEIYGRQTGGNQTLIE